MYIFVHNTRITHGDHEVPIQKKTSGISCFLVSSDIDYFVQSLDIGLSYRVDNWRVITISIKAFKSN